MSPLPAAGARRRAGPAAGGLLAARLATRETLRTPPTARGRGRARSSPRGIGRVRRTAAVVHWRSPASPRRSARCVVPGTVGSADRRHLRVPAGRRRRPRRAGRWSPGCSAARTGVRHGGPATRLALANTRGFSRRLTTVVVPLALVLGGRHRADHRRRHGRHGRRPAAGRRAARRPGRHRRGPGRRRRSPLSPPHPASRSRPRWPACPPRCAPTTRAAWLDSLAWESTPGARAARRRRRPAPSTPRCVDGDLADLDRAGHHRDQHATPASTPARGSANGSRVRWDGGDRHPGRRWWRSTTAGLGFGGYLVGEATPAAHGVDVARRHRPAAHQRPRRRAPRSPTSASASPTSRSTSRPRPPPAGGARDLSTVLLLLLLVFVGRGGRQHAGADDRRAPRGAAAARAHRRHPPPAGDDGRRRGAAHRPGGLAGRHRDRRPGGHRRQRRAARRRRTAARPSRRTPR